MSVNGKSLRIVLTGGPGGGKTTAADLLRREIGEDIVVVPEAATMLFAGGFPRVSEEQARMSAQCAIFHVQRGIEDIQSARYPGRTLLCDRGTVDGAAYWPGGSDHFFKSVDTTLEEELSRYEAVIFFETAAIGRIRIEGGNDYRTETIDEAIALDQRLRDLWSQHPHFVFIQHQASFIKKMTLAVQTLQKWIYKSSRTQ